MPVQITTLATDTWSEFKKWWGQSPHHLNSVNQYPENPLLSTLATINKAVIAVIDIKAMQYTFLSKNFGEYLGRTTQDYKQGGIEFAFSLVPPEDQQGVLAFSPVMKAYFNSLPEEQKTGYRSFWDFRLQESSGSCCRVLQQDCILKYDESGWQEMMLIAHRIENVVSPHSQHLRLTNGIENVFYQYNHQTKAIKRLELLSKREMEIARLIAKSMSLKQISAALNISFNTVKVHSANMLEKLCVNDSLEMVTILRTWGFI